MEKHYHGGNARSGRVHPSSIQNRWTKSISLLFLATFICLVSPLHLVSASEIRRRLAQSSLSRPRTADEWCPLPNVTSSNDDDLKPSDHLMSSEQLQLQVNRLTAAVQVPTESFDDNGDVNEDPRWETFDDFHGVLSELFPLVHSNLELRKVNRFGLQYTLRGSDSSLKPILFTAHQDVVPAGDSSLWTYPPFEAHYDGSFIWGRGAADCKNVLIGVLSVIEDLLAQSFAPQRTIVLAFGFDEETGGLRGAASLDKSLVEEWGSDSFLFVLDEGGMGLQTLGDVLYAYPGVGEKGYYDVQIALQVKGGHSSRPPVHTGIGIMADAILALENEPYLPRLTQTNPFRRVLECNAKYSPDSAPEWLSDALLNDGEEEIANKLVGVMLDERWLMQTSQAVDAITGGHKVNALPEEVQIQVNHRVALHESITYVNQHLRKVLVPIALKYGLEFEYFNTTIPGSNNTLNGSLSLVGLQTLDIAPISPTDGGVWSVFSGTLRYVFESTEAGNGKTVIPAGNIMTGNTDTVHYWSLTKNIYRFTPARDGTRLNQHAIDERMGMTAHLEGMRLYYDLIRNFDGWKEEQTVA